MPSSIELPDMITVRDLALMLRLKPFEVISSLIRLKVFASADVKIDFEKAAAVCSHYGVVATRAA